MTTTAPAINIFDGVSPGHEERGDGRSRARADRQVDGWVWSHPFVPAEKGGQHGAPRNADHAVPRRDGGGQQQELLHRRGADHGVEHRVHITGIMECARDVRRSSDTPDDTGAYMLSSNGSLPDSRSSRLSDDTSAFESSEQVSCTRRRAGPRTPHLPHRIAAPHVS